MSILKKHWPQFFLLASLVFFFRETLFAGKMFVPFGLGLADHNLSTVPLLSYMAAGLKQGQILLWDPNSLGGLPMSGGIITVYHPLNIALFRFLPFSVALNLYLFSIFLIMALGTFYFVKSLKLSNEAALIASLSFTFASGVVARIVHTQILGTIAYLPLLLFLTQKFFEKKNPLLIILSGVILALQILYGHQPAAFISSIGFIGFFLFKTFQEAKKRQILVGLFALLTVFLIGFSLCAVTLMPGLEVFLSSDRSKGISEPEFKEYPFHPGELSYLLRPTPIGNPSLGNYDSPYTDPGIFWENTAYIGLLGLVLGLLAILFLSRSKKTVLFFSFLFVVAVILALGKYTPLSFVWRMPPFSFFRMPARFLLLAMFSLSVLSAFSFDGLTQKYLKHRSWLGIIAGFIILFDLFSFDTTYNAVYDSKKWLSLPQMGQFLKEDPSFFRYYSLGGYEAYYDIYRRFRGWQKNVEPYYNLREGLPASLALIYNLNLAGSAGGISTTALWQKTLYDNLSVNPQEKIAQPNPLALKMLRLLNTKYLVSYFEVKGEDFSLKKTVNFNTGQPGFYLYEISNPLPHAFMVYQTKTFPKGEDFFQEFAKEDFDPEKTLLLSAPTENPSQNETVPSQKVEITQYLPQKVVIKASSSAPGFLLLTDTYYPDWEATIDGNPAKIYQADYLFRAVKMSAGKHQIEFDYKPKSFYRGAAISIASLAIIILFSFSWIAYGVIRKKN